jgi:arginine N-succinyltransferase
MVGQIDALKTISQARDVMLSATHDSGGDKMLIATGQLADYRCAYGYVQEADGAISLDIASAATMGLSVGDSFTMAGRA